LEDVLMRARGRGEDNRELSGVALDAQVAHHVQRDEIAVQLWFDDGAERRHDLIVCRHVSSLGLLAFGSGHVATIR
jgi:hypothetical protein